MSSKLRIKIGEVEIEYEGTEEFLKQELPQLLKTAMELHNVAGTPSEQGAGGGKGGGGSSVPALTTASIAAKLGAKSGTDLLLAAAGHLSFVAKTEPFSRQQLLKAMKSATAYYKKTYSANLSSYIKTALSEQVLSESATNSFALGAKERSNLEKKLAHG